MNSGGFTKHEAVRPPVPWGRLAFWLIASRVTFVTLGIASTHVIAKGPVNASHKLLVLLRHWDAYWYIAIAKEGYHVQKETEELLSVNFFPLYPLLIRGLHYIVQDYWVAAYLVSNTCLVGATALLWKIARRDNPAVVADRATLLFLFNPVTFFYSAAYTESLFLLLLLGMAWFAAERQWMRAGTCGFLLGLSRPVGIIAIVLLVAEFVAPHLAHRRNAEEKPHWPDPGVATFLGSFALCAAGLASYCAFLHFRFGDALAFAHAASSHWHHYLSTPWFSFLDPKFPIFYRLWFQGAALVGLGLLALGFFLRVRGTWLVLTGAYLLVYLSTGTLDSIPRYLSVLFPFYLIAARGGERWPVLEPVVLVVSAVLMALSTILFVNGYWFT